MVSFGDTRLPARFWSRCIPDPNGGCWLWFGQSTAKGYGQICFQANYARRNVYVHRLAYERLVGPIVPGLQIDHRCRVTCCCNPLHLEPVTPSENVRRGKGPAVTRARHAMRMHCPHGHPYTIVTTRSDGRRSRRCSECWKRVNRRAREASRAA